RPALSGLPLGGRHGPVCGSHARVPKVGGKGAVALLQYLLFGFGVMVLLQVLFDGLPLRVRAPCCSHCYTSVMSIPKRSFSIFFFMAYSRVRVGRLFTSSTTCRPWAPS